MSRCRRSEEHTSELQSPCNLVCRLLLEKKKILQSATFLVFGIDAVCDRRAHLPRAVPGRCAVPTRGFSVRRHRCVAAPSLFFFNDTATTEIYTLSLHDALPICTVPEICVCADSPDRGRHRSGESRSEEHTSELQSPCNLVCRLLLEKKTPLNTAAMALTRISSSRFPGSAPRADRAQQQNTSGQCPYPLLAHFRLHTFFFLLTWTPPEPSSLPLRLPLHL